MAGSYIAKLVALGLAMVVHAGVILALGPEGREAVLTEGAAGAGALRLGEGFADMAAGRLEAEARVDAVRPEARDRVEAVRAKMAEPVAGEAVRADRAEPVRVEAVEAVEAEPVRSDLIRAAPVRAGAAAVETPARAESAPAQERIAGVAPESAAVGQSLRPVQRDPAREKPREKARPAPASKPAAPQGNAARDARAGEATGQAQAEARSRATQGKADAAGSTAVGNYPGLVMRKLTRAGRPRVNARGEAVVGFTIADNGGLAALGIVRGSGSAALDRAALGIVRGAAPFPKPPRGAERRFSIRIKGR